MSEPVAHGMSESVARGIGRLNQAAIHAAGSWTPKSPMTGPNHTPIMVLLAVTFTLYEALAKNSAGKFELAVVEIRALPVVAGCRALPPDLTYADFTEKARLLSKPSADTACPLRPSAGGPGPGRRVSF